MGFFVSGHPLARFATEVALFGTRTTAELGVWTDEKLAVAAVVTAVKRQIARRSGAEWAKLVAEDFHGTATCLAFPEAWSKLARVVAADGAYLLLGGYTARDRGEEDVPFIVEDAVPLADLRASGRIGLALRWGGSGGPVNGRAAEAARAVAALCAAHPGPAPLFLDWTGGATREHARFRSRALTVALDDELLDALKDVLGRDAVTLVKAG